MCPGRDTIWPLTLGDEDLLLKACGFCHCQKLTMAKMYQRKQIDNSELQFPDALLLGSEVARSSVCGPTMTTGDCLPTDAESAPSQARGTPLTCTVLYSCMIGSVCAVGTTWQAIRMASRINHAGFVG